ncbi:hypothetical protein EDF35_1057 [Rathayibacter sp. PhB151]|uniref:DUF5684 domain-containing protein n=1 Tax=Rathayibacter sp. PhB151 TaxID=2485189 RepID=UPI0010CFB936|nr:DUF5684 domain-containing protein [Rathayibacter sp. PhB151]TDX81390.1 hypothetical protein EDF35_1057 [Rathayibacter sp. PhB151]
MLDAVITLAQTSLISQNDVPSGLNAATSVGSFFGGLIGYVIAVVALWPVFTKAGRPGWGALIPIYNTYLLTKIAGHHGATVLLFLIPFVNVIWAIFIALGVGRAFGKGALFSIVLLWLLAIIGYLVVGYGSSRYIGDGGNPARRPR